MWCTKKNKKGKRKDRECDNNNNKKKEMFVCACIFFFHVCYWIKKMNLIYMHKYLKDK